jgi:hypothetical protein
VGRVYIRTFADCNKHGLVLKITCSRCRRAVYRHAADLVGIKTPAGREIRGHHELEDVAPAMRCRGGKGSIGCGGKGAVIRACWPHELKVPAGVPLLPFLNADDRERKRLIRVARG